MANGVRTPLIGLASQALPEIPQSNVFQQFERGARLADILQTSQLNREINEQALNAARQQQNLQSAQRVAREIEPLLMMDDTQAASNIIDRELRSELIDPEFAQGLQDFQATLFQDPIEAIRRVKFLNESARMQAQPKLTPRQQEFQQFIGMPENTAAEQKQKREFGVLIGAIPKMESIEQQIQRLEETGDIKLNQAIKRAGGVEAAKLAQQLKLTPRIKGATTTAIENAKLVAKINEKNRSNASAIRVYEAGITGLADALDQPITGPIIGSLPAITADQQIADGAVAAMAPILKQIFRVAGEGTFTDQDQKLLLDMVPTRKDFAEARQSKLRNIDTIIQAKLGVQGLPEDFLLPEGFDPIGGQQVAPEQTTPVQPTTTTIGRFQVTRQN